MRDVHWIDTGQWPSALAVIAKEPAYKRFIRQYCGKDHDPLPFPRKNAGLCQHLQDDIGQSILLIAVGPQINRAELACTLAHEATHAMRWMLEFVGEKEPGTETEAYLVEHILRHGMRALTSKR